MKRFLSSPFFLVALICFFLPFFAVTCAGFGTESIPGLGEIPGGSEAQEATEVTGLELATGQAEENLRDTDQLDPSGIPGIQEGVGPSPGPSVLPGAPQGGEGPDLGMTQIWAIAAAAVALLGIFLSLLAGRAGGAIALVLGGAGAALLFLLKSEFTNAITSSLGEQAESFIEVEPKIGFWLSLAGFGLAAVLGLVRLLLPDRPTLAPPAGTGFGAPPVGPPPVGPPPDAPPPAGPPPGPPGPPPPGSTSP